MFSGNTGGRHVQLDFNGRQSVDAVCAGVVIVVDDMQRIPCTCFLQRHPEPVIRLCVNCCRQCGKRGYQHLLIGEVFMLSFFDTTCRLNKLHVMDKEQFPLSQNCPELCRMKFISILCGKTAHKLYCPHYSNNPRGRQYILYNILIEYCEYKYLPNKYMLWCGLEIVPISMKISNYPRKILEKYKKRCKIL